MSNHFSFLCDWTNFWWTRHVSRWILSVFDMCILFYLERYISHKIHINIKKINAFMINSLIFRYKKNNIYIYISTCLYSTDKSSKYARRSDISAVYILIIPGIINNEETKVWNHLSCKRSCYCDIYRCTVSISKKRSHSRCDRKKVYRGISWLQRACVVFWTVPNCI